MAIRTVIVWKVGQMEDEKMDDLKFRRTFSDKITVNIMVLGVWTFSLLGVSFFIVFSLLAI